MPLTQSFLRTTTNSWRNQSAGLRIMRLWLGITWIYAGWHKASDAGFLTKGSATFIGTQLSGYSERSPLGDFAFNTLIEHPIQVGAFVMVSELAIGIATLLWVAPTLAAFGGFSMSLGLWLASSFNVNPYFLASDTAYAVLWLSYFLLILGKRRSRDVSVNRRGAMRVAIVGVMAIGAAALGRVLAQSTKASAAEASSKKQIAKLSDLPVGSVSNFVLASGEPAILFRTNTGVFAYSAICTHQGCTVAYSDGSKTLACPCHGGQFDPFASAAVVAGPPQSPLSSIKVAIDGDWVILV
jgi:thiosulfate dehydrogenase [quinone] large subunit